MKKKQSYMWIQKYQLSFPITEEEEDRSCLAVQFAWDWDQFPVAVDGSPSGITISPTELENVKQFNEEFVPSLNKALEADGFYPAVANRTSNQLFIDLDDPTARIGFMEGRKALLEAGLSIEEVKAVKYEDIIHKLREVSGRFIHYNTAMKLIDWRDENGQLCAAP